MGFKLRSFGKHVAGNMGKMAQGVADKLECSVIAPPVPIMLGAFAVCTGVAFVRHIRNRRGRNDQTSSPPSSEPSSSSPAQSAAASAIDDIPSPRSPVAPSTHVSSIVPFRLKDAVVRRPPVAITNGPLTMFGPPATPEAGPVAIASAPDLIPFTTPDKDAEDGLDYDELEEGQELSKLQNHYRASKVLAEISNREADSSSPASSKVSKSIPPLNLSKVAEKGVRVRQASAQLSRPNKLLGQENEMQAIC